MLDERIMFSNKLISLSESDDGTTLKGRFLICPLNEGNSNGVGLKEDDLSEDELKGLVGQPVVTKVIKNIYGDLDLSGHNMKKVIETDKDGKPKVKYVFDTTAIGYHESVEVVDLEVNGLMKRCIVADCKLWLRYEDAISVVARLFEENNLHSSWEISYSDSYTEDGVKWLKSIKWIGNCLLGSNVNPAYKISGALELSEENQDDDLELAKAFTQDLIKLNEISSNEEVDINENQGGNKVMVDETIKNEIASVTQDDLYTKVRKAINSIDNNKWYWISRIYPYEYRAIAYESYDRENEDDYVEFIYTVNSDDTVSITSQKDVKMTFIPKESFDTLKTEVANLQTELSNKNDDITKLGQELSSKEEIIKKKETEISELTPFKEQIEKAEAEKKELEIAEKKESLKVLATRGGYIKIEELETSELLKKAIDELDEKTIKAEIAERVMAKIEQAEEKKEEVTPEVEISENKPTLKVNINSTENSDSINPMDIMTKFLSK